MFSFIDRELNTVTMYRMTLYSLIFILSGAVVLGAFGIIPQNPFAIIFSVAFLLFISDITNTIFAKVYGVVPNTESLFITALILAALISPPTALTDTSYYVLALWAALWAMASKYIVAVRKRHIFNPAAFAVALTSFTLGLSATWWVGMPQMLPFVAVGGLLLLRKIHRNNLVVSFFISTFLFILVPVFFSGGNVPSALLGGIIHSAIIFFATIMLTEPLTTPGTKSLRIAYGATIGFFFAPWIHIGSVYGTPELALLAGNLLFFFLSPKAKLFLKLKEVTIAANDTADFIFEPGQKLNFKAGQYMEWTLAHENPDNRGNRRYFTIASSPTEPELHFGIKFYDPPSSFKKHLADMKKGDDVVVSQIAGDFVLPRDKKKKLAWIAGGIGVTPFRAMAKYLSDTGEKRDAVLLYGNRTVKDVAYADVFEEAAEKFGLRSIYSLSDINNIPANWNGEKGNIDAEMIARTIPDFRDRYFYISGPYHMVLSISNALRDLGVKRSKIKTDFFPGFS